jgi:uncharacterized membrane protein YqhA
LLSSPRSWLQRFTFLWGLLKTLTVIVNLIVSRGKDPLAAINLIELMDIFLIATVLFIFAMGMYELFIDNISLPEWLIIRNLHDLKVKLSSVIVLVMGIIFLEHLVEWNDPQGTLFFGIAVAVVSASHSISVFWREGLIISADCFVYLKCDEYN